MPQEMASPAVAEWERRGEYRELVGYKVFTIDMRASGTEDREPLLVLHGFPTSSFDFCHVVDRLGRGGRVLLLDMIGYGLSAKPDMAYTLDVQADVVTAFVAETGVRSLCLLTHDVGDSVGGELLARHSEGRFPAEVTRRVVTNGSIYIEMAKLSAGQQMLLALPDERLAETAGVDAAAVAAGLRATFSARSKVPDADVSAACDFVTHADGHLLLPRTIRYIEERRRHQDRYTGAIERHPSPLSIVWGTDDPIALSEMASRLAEARPDASLEWLPGVGHYPMLEAPELFAACVERALT
ncbi:MAG: alpha/beta hydrolase [Acidimicrobiales bacterium]